MKPTLVLTSIALMIFIAGCGHHEHDADKAGSHEHHDEIGSDEHDAHDHDDHEHGSSKSDTPKVLLDNGKRWTANKETTEGIAKMTALVTNYEGSTGDPKTLKALLEEEFALIFERCTMTGEAHDQLHSYLLPMHQELKNINLSKASEVSELKAYLGTYGNYFE